MNREEMIDKLVEKDMEDIKRQLMNDDYFLLDAILRGEAGWKQYAYLTDKEIQAEYEDRIAGENE